jgi:hypothetical protein
LLFKDDDFQLRHEDELMLCCARTKINDEIEKKIISLASMDLDWEYLINMASRHRLKPLLYVNLNSICPEYVPEDVLGNLKSYYLANVQKNLMLTGELVKVMNLLEENDIKCVPYKGPVLALTAYGSLSLRDFDDLDILISRDNAIKTKKILLKNGYEHKFTINDSHEELYVKTQREYQFYNKENKMLLEIQWKFTTSHFSSPRDLEYLFDFNSLKKQKNNNINFYGLCVEDIILILCIHNASHRWMRLAWLCDIAEVINVQEVDWNKLLLKASNYNIERVLLINLLLSNEILDLELPNQILDKLSDKNVINISKKVISSFFDKNEKKSILNQTILRFKIRENWIMGLKDCIKLAFLPTPREWDEFSVSPNFYSFYYLFRLLKLRGRF